MNNEDPRSRYIAQLASRTPADLLDDLQGCTRSNSYGSHDDQIALLRAELERRMAR